MAPGTGRPSSPPRHGRTRPPPPPSPEPPEPRPSTSKFQVPIQQHSRITATTTPFSSSNQLATQTSRTTRVRPSVRLFSSEALILSVFLFLPPPPPFSILVTLTHSFLQGVSSSLVASYSWPRPSAVSALCDCVSLLFALRGFARSRRQHEEGSFKLANEWGKC